MRTIVLRPAAKINLSLRVGSRREDGFHDVRTLLQSVALFDTLRISARQGPFVLATRAPGIPADRTNLVWRAADRLWRALGRSGDPRDAHVKLDKRIPAAAGLGGGSADAAAALVGLNTIWTGRQSRSRLLALAADLGADVPFFLLGGTSLGTGRGDEVYPVDDIRQTSVVIIKPSFSIITADAYRWFDDDGATRSDRLSDRPSEFDTGWPSGGTPIGNDLQGPIERRHPAIREMCDALTREGAHAASMTGSGSAVFGLFSDAVARKAARRLQRPDWLVLLTRTLSRREAARRLGL